MLNDTRHWIVEKKPSEYVEVDVAHTSNKHDSTTAVAGVIYQDAEPELYEVPDLEGYHQKEGVRDVRPSMSPSSWLRKKMVLNCVC